MEYKNPFQYLSADGADFSAIEKQISLPNVKDAPIKKGEKIGEAVYRLGTEKIGSVDIIAAKDITQAAFSDYMKKIFLRYFS